MGRQQLAPRVAQRGVPLAAVVGRVRDLLGGALVGRHAEPVPQPGDILRVVLGTDDVGVCARVNTSRGGEGVAKQPCHVSGEMEGERTYDEIGMLPSLQR